MVCAVAAATASAKQTPGTIVPYGDPDLEAAVLALRDAPAHPTAKKS